MKHGVFDCHMQALVGTWANGLFLILEGCSMLTDPSTGKKEDALFTLDLHTESCSGKVACVFQLIFEQHTMVATQRMP